MDDHGVVERIVLVLSILLNLFAGRLSEFSELVSIHGLPLVRTSLHLNLGNLVKGLSLALSNDEVIRNIPDKCILDIFTKVIWRSSPSKLSCL